MNRAFALGQSVSETFVPKDVVLHVGPSPLAKVLETFMPKDYAVLYLGSSPFAFVQKTSDWISIPFCVQSI